MKKDLSCTVGLVGLPNTGKSSVINTLSNTTACSVAPIPGHTKHLATIKLDKKISLIDSPGVVLQKLQTEAEKVLKNCMKVADVVDPVLAGKYVCHVKCFVSHRSPSFEDTGENYIGGIMRQLQDENARYCHRIPY